MKRSSILAYFAAVLLFVASIFNYIEGAVFRGVIGTIGGISFILAGIHWGRTDKLNNKNIK